MSITSSIPESRSEPKETGSAELLSKRVILVTGAGDGIGRVAATTYANHGATLVLLGKTRTKLEAVSDAIVAKGGELPLIVPSDLSNLDEAHAQRLREGIEREFGQLDGILHNASILGQKTPIEHYSGPLFREVIDINLTAAFLITKALLPLLSQSQDASVIFTSSGVGRTGRAFWGAYAVSKFATEGLMEVLADELRATTNIRVNSLNPGATRTGMRAAAYPAEDPESLPTPEEHMDLYLYLIGPASKGITGQRFDAKGWT